MAALDFPASPINGQVFTGVGGINWVWDGAKWNPGTSSIAGTGQFLPLAGGTLTGNLTIATATDPGIILNKSASGKIDFIQGNTNGSARWFMMLGDETTESATSTGSDFGINRYNNTGVFIDQPLKITRSNGEVIASPLFKIRGLVGHSAAADGTAIFSMQKGAAGAANVIYASNQAGVLRWAVALGDTATESGSNNGSLFSIQRFSDAGAPLGQVMRMDRIAGNTVFGGYVGVNNAGASVDVALAVQHTHTGTPSYFWELSTIEVQDSRALMLGVGGFITFSCKYDTGGNWAALGGIGARKVSATSGDAAGSLQLWSRSGPINFYSGSGGVLGGPPNLAITTTGNLVLGYGGQINWGTTGYPILAADATHMYFQLPDGNGSYIFYNRGGGVFAEFRGSANTTLNISGAWATLSDASLKENITPYTNGLASIISLEPVNFDYIEGTGYGGEERHIGLIAQDAQEFVPELVGESEITVDGEKRVVATMQPSNLIYAVINAIKELNTRLEALEVVGSP